MDCCFSNRLPPTDVHPQQKISLIYSEWGKNGWKHFKIITQRNDEKIIFGKAFETFFSYSESKDNKNSVAGDETNKFYQSMKDFTSPGLVMKMVLFRNHFDDTFRDLMTTKICERFGHFFCFFREH